MPLPDNPTIDAALANVAWDIGNGILYNLCQQHPLHNNPGEVIAKVWLIGRSYAAAIERRRYAAVYGDAFYVEDVAPQMIEAGIDAWINPLPFQELADADAHSTAIEVHQQLTALFDDMTGQRKRSLASKYLHFHRPNHFFIYDSRAVDALAHMEVANQAPLINAGDCDTEYRRFHSRCVWLQQELALQVHYGRLLTPRELDKIFLHLAAAIGNEP